MARVISSIRRHDLAGGHGLPGKLWWVARRTVAELFRYRVTGLAAEAAFFALLSLPPLVLGLVGTLGYFRSVVGRNTISQIRTWIVEHAHVVLADSAVDRVVVPLVDDVLGGAAVNVISVSFLVSLWAGSRALNVYVDTITIAYGLAGLRGIVTTRLLAFLMYLVGLVVGVVVIPLLVAGPTLVTRALPESTATVHMLYWPTVVVLSILFLATLYHVSVPVRTPWQKDLPGAVLAVGMWILGSFLLRLYLGASLSGVSVYGSLAAPVGVLAWLFVTAFAVLTGATLNAEIDKIWPSPATARARAHRSESPERNQLELRNAPH